MNNIDTAAVSACRNRTGRLDAQTFPVSARGASQRHLRRRAQGLTPSLGRL